MNEVSLILIRSVITFFSLLVFSRMLGKTQISHLSFFEYVAGITIGSIAGALTTNLDMPPWPLFVALATWTSLTLLTQFVAMKHRWAEKLLDGEPVLVIQNGQVLERNLRSIRMRSTELNTLLRNQGVFDIGEVQYAIMETPGTLSVMKRPQYRAVTPADLHLPTSTPGLPHELIVDGEVVAENLAMLRLPREWLTARLKERGLDSPAEVFLAVIDSNGALYLDTYRDQVPREDRLWDDASPN